MDETIVENLKQKKTIHTITLVKGIVIIFVVVGHYFPESSPLYWVMVRDFIYKFHMPLFFMLSGFLFQFSCIKEVKLFPGLMMKKIKRLIFPFLTIAAIFMIIKTLTHFFISLQYPVTLSSILYLFINPAQSFAPLLWFIYTLFFIQLLFQAIQLLVKHTIITLIISLLLLLIPIPATNVVYYIFRYLPFFVVGYGLSQRENPDQVPVSRIIIVTLVSLCCAFFFLWIDDVWGKYILLSKMIRFIIGSSLSFLCIGLSAILVRIRHMVVIKVLAHIGFYAMGIYLLHTIFESFIRIIFLEVFPINLPFILIALLAILAGIIFPLIIEQLVLRRFKVTRRFILGIR